MYVQEQMSVSQIARTLKEGLDQTQCVRKTEIVTFLKSEGVFRTHSETMLASFQHRSYTCVCESCRSIFDAVQPFTKFCKGCAPNHQAWSRVSVYGLTQEAFQEMMTRQQSACAICKTSFATLIPHKNKTHTFVIDHDHASNRVRGLLCSECNVTLGHIEKKTADWLPTAMTYIGKAAA